MPIIKGKDTITMMLNEKNNKDVKQHIVECQSIKLAYRPIIVICNKNTWRNCSWITENTEVYNDLYGSIINIENLTFAINKKKTSAFGFDEIIDTNIFKLTK